MAKDAETEDGGLLTRIVARDPEALATLYDRYRGVVMAFALRVLRDRAEAEEALVDVFHQVWRQADSFDSGRGSVAAWLMTLCRSRAVDRLRQRVRRQAVEAGDGALAAMPSTGNRPDAAAESSLVKRRVMKALGVLSAGQREAIELAYYEGMSHSEIAKQLGEPLGTVKTRIRQGMSALRASLSAHEG
ncbi:MAG TPA: sigma-70 family RNA polymerase sigma factor [Candidatus Polarisedimenticolaceae bacterium]|nr:sigma-70 family RNA polymerase sigma factor [Candidatus Polarisedimenticolaceae bacterium]